MGELDYFVKLEQRREAHFKEKDRLEGLLKEYLAAGDRGGLIAMLDFFYGETGEQLIGEFSELLQLCYICGILKMERDNKCVEGDFLTGVEDVEALYRKYALTVFTLRRLEMDMGDECREELLAFLLKEKISAACICMICIQELFAFQEKIVLELFRISKGSGYRQTAADVLLFWLGVNRKSPDVLLGLAEHAVDCGDVEQAYWYLLQIEDPKEEIQGLIASMEGILG